MPNPQNIEYTPIAFPRDQLAILIEPWLARYEEARKQPGADDLGHPSLIALNAKSLSEYVGSFVDHVYALYTSSIIQAVANHAYAAGLGKPMPTFSVRKPEEKVRGQPKRAIQTVERDPQTQEVIRTVTNYQE